MASRLPIAGRISRRRVLAVPIPITLRLESRGEKTSHTGFALDISTGGMRLRLTTPVQQGQAVELLPSGSKVPVVPGKVAWVGKKEPSWTIEARIEFLRPVSIDDWLGPNPREP